MESKQPDELDKVVIAFNDMKIKLIGNYQQIEKFNNELEEKVKNRTKALNKAYQHLEKQFIEQKQAEERYRLTVESSIDGFWVVDTDGKLLTVNDAYCNMVGYSQYELLGMSIMDVEAVLSKDGIEQHLQKIRKQGSDRFETQQELYRIIWI